MAADGAIFIASTRIAEFTCILHSIATKWRFTICSTRIGCFIAISSITIIALFSYGIVITISTSGRLAIPETADIVITIAA